MLKTIKKAVKWMNSNVKAELDYKREKRAFYADLVREIGGNTRAERLAGEILIAIGICVASIGGVLIFDAGQKGKG